MSFNGIFKIISFEETNQMRNVGKAHIAKEKNEVGSFENPVLVSSLRETVRESKAIVGEPDNDVSE